MILEELKSATAILLVSIAAAVSYGITHDLVTAHVCVEYFTVAHPIIIPSDDPILLALLWGVIATWWVGLILGIPLAIAARLGKRPKLTARDLLPRLAKLLITMGLFALSSGLVGYSLHKQEKIELRGPLASEIPEALHSRFFFDAFAHTTSYLVGFLGGIILTVLVWRERKRKA